MIGALVVFVCLVATSMQTAVNVSVYYESLCPDSIRFFARQLNPTWKTLTSEYLLPDFVPYGKASQVQDEQGTWKFTCQHGSSECEGNKLQACAINEISNEQQMIKFINCVMTSSYPPSSGAQCATGLGIDFSPIETCFNTTRGDNLLAMYGDRTHNFQPVITFVPTIAFNGVYNVEDQEGALTNLKSVVCRHIVGTKPHVCDN